MTAPLILQLGPFSPTLEGELASRFEVQRWFENDDREAWLQTNAGRVSAAITGGDVGLPNALMDRLPNLGIIAINGVGFDKVDLERARGRGIRVTSTPDVLTDDVADLAIGLILSLLRKIAFADKFVRDDRWPHGAMPLGHKVSGKRFGIVGLGRIGGAIAARLAPFGAVAYTNREQKAAPYRFVPQLVDLAAESDILILSTTANASTHKMVDAKILQALGPQGYLVNIARGSLVDEEALMAALAQKQIAGAALDVFADEPIVPKVLRELPNVVLTPHIASATVETRTRMAELVLENLDAFFKGSPLPSALV